MNAAPHLTRVSLNTRSKEVRRDLANIHELHRTVMSLFRDINGDTPREELGVLYRIENTSSGATLLVQSAEHPNVEMLPAGYGSITTISMHNLLTRIQKGTNVRYRIVANLTTSRKNLDGKYKKVALGHQPAMEKWVQLAAENGLDLLSEPQALATTITGQRNKNNLTFRPWTIDGVATITDPEKLAHAITYGLGRGKAYGCGLLSIAIL